MASQPVSGGPSPPVHHTILPPAGAEPTPLSVPRTSTLGGEPAENTHLLELSPKKVEFLSCFLHRPLPIPPSFKCTSRAGRLLTSVPSTASFFSSSLTSFVCSFSLLHFIQVPGRSSSPSAALHDTPPVPHQQSLHPLSALVAVSGSPAWSRRPISLVGATISCSQPLREEFLGSRCSASPSSRACKYHLPSSLRRPVLRVVVRFGKLAPFFLALSTSLRRTFRIASIEAVSPTRRAATINIFRYPFPNLDFEFCRRRIVLASFQNVLRTTTSNSSPVSLSLPCCLLLRRQQTPQAPRRL